MTTAYPLSWPDGWPRTSSSQRKHSRFVDKERRQYSSGGSYLSAKTVTVASAVDRVLDELKKMGVPDWNIIAISTNVQPTLSGRPRSGQSEPSDPGAAVYWRDPFSEQQMCMAIDQYTTVAGNLAAIAATLDAMRAIERHGGGEIMQRAYRGFAALPSPETASVSPWRSVLGLGADATRDDIERAYRVKRKEAHPDHGGTSEQFHSVQTAYEMAIQEKPQ